MGQLVLEQLRRQHLTVGAPYIAPTGLPCVDDVGHQIGGVLSGGVRQVGNIQLHAAAATGRIAAIEGIAACAAHHHAVDVSGVGLVLLRHRFALPRCQLFIHRFQRQRYRHIVDGGLHHYRAILQHVRGGIGALLQTVEALHEVGSGTAGRRVVAKAEGIENGLDLQGVKAAALGFGIHGGDRRIQKRESCPHLGDVVFVFGWDFLRKGRAIEGRGHGEIVMLHRRRAEAAQERRQQDQR